VALVVVAIVFVVVWTGLGSIDVGRRRCVKEDGRSVLLAMKGMIGRGLLDLRRSPVPTPGIALSKGG
jgi:hypothetical protein